MALFERYCFHCISIGFILVLSYFCMKTIYSDMVYTVFIFQNENAIIWDETNLIHILACVHCLKRYQRKTLLCRVDKTKANPLQYSILVHYNVIISRASNPEMKIVVCIQATLLC